MGLFSPPKKPKDSPESQKKPTPQNLANHVHLTIHYIDDDYKSSYIIPAGAIPAVGDSLFEDVRYARWYRVVEREFTITPNNDEGLISLTVIAKK